MNGFILTKHNHLELVFKTKQQFFVRCGDRFRWDARYRSNDLFHLADIDCLLALARRHHLLQSANLINDVNGLVRHITVVDVAIGQLCSGFQSLVGVLNFMMLFKARLEPFKDFISILNGRLCDIDFLETTGQSAVFLENATEFRKCG